jgi:formylglycine-generating enzyme required for sulfatase activity
MGNAWEWAEDHYAAFPGFKVHPYYEDFSSPCFAGKHQLVSTNPKATPVLYCIRVSCVFWVDTYLLHLPSTTWWEPVIRLSAAALL